MSIFHWKYVQMCPGYKLLENVNISFEIYVNVFTADPTCQYFNRNMCKSAMGPSWIPIRILHGSYVGAQRAVHGSLYGSYMGPQWIPVRIYMDPYMILYGSLYGSIYPKIIEFYWKT